MFTLISYQFGKSGYTEDDWQIIRKINNKKDFLEALKEGYLQDASNRSNYPLNGQPNESIITKQEFNYDGYVYLGGSYYDDNFEPEYNDLRYLKDEDIDLSEYDEVYIKFDKWKKKLKSLIPRIREIKIKKDNSEQELKRLFQLAKKYNYTLTKGE